MKYNPRLMLWLAVALLLFINYQTWMRDNAPLRAAVPPPATSPTSTPNAAPGQPPAAADLSQRVPAPATAAPATPSTPGASTPAAATNTATTAAAPAGAGSIHVVTDVFDIAIGLLGGELQRADLLKYPRVKDSPDPVRLLMSEGAGATYVLQTGLSGPAGGGARPTHVTVWKSAAQEYRLEAGGKELRVPLTWTNDAGVSVTKTFVFRPGLYRIDIEYQIENRSAEAWAAAPYAQILHDVPPVARSYFKIDTAAYQGPAMWDKEKKYKRLKIADPADASMTRPVEGGWFAALQHHFTSILVPPAGQTYVYSLRSNGNQYLATTAGPLTSVAPGTTAMVPQTMFAGPKLQGQLNEIGPELDRVADYGWATFLARPLFWMLRTVHDLVRNWGLAIIVVTMMLKLLFYPLAEVSGRSMAKMKQVQPRLKAIQETYKDDREKLGRATMDLYKREKINPATGCLPNLVQIPVFLAFYWVLIESVEMRQQPFAFWIQDLSSRDPYFILPAIMAAAMFAQFKLQPQPTTDPVQQKIFMVLPLVMSATFALFPAGLVLYWVTNTLLTILQQWNINRRLDARSKAR